LPTHLKEIRMSKGNQNEVEIAAELGALKETRKQRK
jgi:hypothetical protein